MKQVKLILVGGDDYEKVETTFERLPKWDFLEAGKAELECVLLDKKEVDSKFKAGDKFTIYFIKHRQTKVDYSILPNSILGDRLKDIPLYSAVKIVFTGMKQASTSPKKYQNYEVYRAKNFKFDPSVWQPANYVKDEATETVSTTGSQQPVAQQEAMDDLPF